MDKGSLICVNNNCRNLSTAQIPPGQKRTKPESNNNQETETDEIRQQKVELPENLGWTFR